MLLRSGVAALLLLLASGCGADPDRDVSAPASAATPASPVASETPSETAGGPTPSPTQTKPRPAPGTRIIASDSEFGPMLFDRSGQAIYLFDVETSSRAECYGECAVAWPPVLTDGKPVAGRGVDRALLGTTERRDGSIQVTYNDHPLYFYAHEAKWEVKCHDVFLNGGGWFVVQPGGDAAPPG